MLAALSLAEDRMTGSELKARIEQIIADKQLCLAGEFDCFGLFNRCEPIGLHVYVESNGLGLTDERVRTVAESRLRAARLFDQESGPFLAINVDLPEDRNLFSYDLSFLKWMTDDVTKDMGLVGRWETSRFGTHGNDAGFILQGISELMDSFINEYLRINEPACN